MKICIEGMKILCPHSNQTVSYCPALVSHGQIAIFAQGQSYRHLPCTKIPVYRATWKWNWEWLTVWVTVWHNTFRPSIKTIRLVEMVIKTSITTMVIYDWSVGVKYRSSLWHRNVLVSCSISQIQSRQTHTHRYIQYNRATIDDMCWTVLE